MKKELLNASKTIALALMLGVGVSYLSAWVGPTLPPPDGNVPEPINIGNLGQTKAGGISLNSSGAPYGLLVEKGFVGIGTLTPTATLEVAGNVKITGGNPGVGKVLTSDATGLATWQTPQTQSTPSAGVVIEQGVVDCYTRGDCGNLRINFSRNFTRAPHVIVTPTAYDYWNNCRSDNFSVGLRVASVTTQGFNAELGGSGGGCGGVGFRLLEVSWIAIGQ